MEIGHVDDDVVEVLAGDALVIGDEHVLGREAVAPVLVHAVDDEDAEIGHEMRHAADILRHQRAVGQDERGAEIAHLVDHHVVGGAVQIGRHLVGDGGERVAHDLERDRIDLDRHQGLSTAMMSSPVSATLTRSPGKSTVVEPYSLTSAGPTSFAPAGSSSRR